MAPRLSLILCSRNDGYMGNALWRLETTLNYAGERVEMLGRSEDVEVIVADWGSEAPLRDAVALTPAASRIVSFVTVPPVLARSLQRDSPFPEVLALNVAARRAAGTYIGRIDQDTLVGERFLRWFFESIGSQGPHTLFFANRRNIPYRFTSLSPRLGDVARFVRKWGASLPVNQQNPSTGDVFWTSDVGIWLAHRNLWLECGGYDERLIYYNWMETDMICRLRQKYAVVDLGATTGFDFFHLEHFHPRRAWFARPHARKNAPVDLQSPPAVFHPNSADWGLRDAALARSSAAAVDAATVSRPRSSAAGFAWLMMQVACATVLDRAVILWTSERQVFARRLRRVRQEIAGKPVPWWPGLLWTLWAGRHSSGRRNGTGLRSGRLRTMLAKTLSALGLLTGARRTRLRIALALNRTIRRREREERDQFRQFSRDYGAVVGLPLLPRGRTTKTALVVSSRCPTIEGELCVIKALQLAGFRPVILLEDERRTLRPFYELAGVERVHLWSEFLTSANFSSEAAALLSRCRSLDDLLNIRRAGVRVGMITLCTTLRRSRCGTLNLEGPGVRDLLTRALAASLSATVEARSILGTVGPELVLTDPEYTPKGEMFETCVENGLDVVSYDTAHSHSALMFKRYGRQNRDCHLTTLSSRSWNRLQNLEWTSAIRRQLDDEVTTRYRDGDWFGTPWTAGAGSSGREAVLRSLGLDASKKTAFIFPHMLWDAPVMWGRPLFSTYQEWFVETVRAACRNTAVNWVVRIHPAHVWKQADEGYQGEAAELALLRQQLGSLPPHVVVVPPDAPVSTLTLFAIMDYCLTVRGTVGVEAARLGIPVLTAGPARYAGLGFTIDSASRGEYLARLSGIQATPPLSSAQRELAERFAYGLFLLRPLKLASVTWDAVPSAVAHRGAQRRARLNIRTEDDWRRAADISALAAWFGSHEEDFIARAG